MLPWRVVDSGTGKGTQVHAEGWTVEAAIPMITLRFAETDGEQTWGAHILCAALEAHRHRPWRWPPHGARDAGRPHRLSHRGAWGVAF